MKLSHRMKRAEHFRSHKRSPLSAYLREVIYGAVDGIITTFAVVAGFSGAALSGDTTSQLSFAVVLLFGLANLFADGVSMGLGNFLAVRSEQGLYRSLRVREKDSSEQNGSLEAHETVSALIEKGFSEADVLD
jgi:vacuolar iron transporter family protein